MVQNKKETIRRTLQLLLGQGILVLVEVEEFLWNRLGGRLIIRVMVRLEIGVLQGILDSDAFDWVECKQLVEKVQGEVRRVRKHGLPWDLLFERQGADVLASTARLDAVVVLHGRGAENIEDERQLVVVYAQLGGQYEHGQITYSLCQGTGAFHSASQPECIRHSRRRLPWCTP